jgi:5'' nucleotidase, deoxy (Pyrimidine), cytosolic type C protein (NT5C).
MKDIIIDIDDVIASLGVAACKLLEKETGVSIKFESCNSYDYYKNYGLNESEFLNIITREKLFSSVPFEKGAVNALKKLHKNGYSINFVTSRGFCENAEQITANWLESGKIKFERLLIVPKGMTKSSQYSKIGDKFDFIVDDFHLNLSDAKKSGIVNEFILIDKPWNRHVTEYVLNENRFCGLESFVFKKLNKNFFHERDISEFQI